MAVLSIGQVWATDEVVYTLNPVKGSDNSYGSAEDIDITDGETTITWSVMGNSKDYAPWRIGGKGITNAIRPIYSKNAISDNITKVVVTHGDKNISTVSLKLYVYSTAAAAASGGSTNLISTVDGGTLAANDVKTFNRPTGHDWTGRFYRLEYSCTQSGSSNKYILFNKAEFYAEAAAPAYTITAQSNDESKGTVSLTGSVITGSPKANCRYASPAYTVTSGNATVAQSGNAFTVTPSSDCTVRINFEAIPQYTVTWNNNGSTSTSQVLEGNKPVFPATPAACDATSTTFIGWATAPWTGKLADLSEKTVYTSASAMPDVDAAITYYAVFAKSSGSASNLFNWEGGGKTDLLAIEGIVSSSLDADYAASHDPYLVKWNSEGKYLIIPVSAQPGKVSVGFKMIGGNTTSTVDIQESTATDGEFTNVETLTISGATNDVVNLETTNAFKSTTRAIKLLYHKGSNVGLGPISIEGAVSMSDYMTTCAAPTCENLGTPVVNVTNKTYNSARLTWAAVTNAAKYLVKFNGEDQEATDNLYFDAVSLDAETQYTYQVKALAAANQEDWCDGEFSDEANFTTEPAPSATLTLMENGNEVDGGSHTVSVPFPLPTEVSHTCGKTFVGWDDDENCDHAPTYAPGANFTFSSTAGVTLYAVYADVAPGTTTNIAYTGSTTGNMTGGNDAADLVDATDLTGWSVIGYKGGGSNYPGLNKDGTIRLYYHANGNSYIEVTAPQTIASVTLTMGDLNNVVVKVGENTVAISDGVYPIGASSFAIINGNTTSVQAHIKNIAVNFQGAQSNWATTCVDPLENPTFSLAPVVTPVEDKYTEAINVVITNNAGEGKIYYTTNNQTPTSASTEYTGAITLNTCGTKTIKAVVISDNNQSEVVSATYEMAIPIPSVSAEDPYTEAEAVAVIDGGCYNNEDVYVTGTVASNGAAWYPNSGTYTITLENGFKFYYFYEGENEQAFTENYIAAGDELVAKGKLEKSGNTYRLAQGCYLVSRTPAQKTPIDSDIDNPITVADALDYIDQAATYDLTNVYVKGVASEDPDNQGTFNIHDADVDNTFQIYKGVLSQELIDAGVVVEENDTVIAVGELTKFYSTYEMAQGGEIVVVKKYNAPVVNVESVDMTESSASVEVGETVTLHAAVNPDNATDQAIVWSVQSGNDYASVDENGVVTGTAEGTAVIRAAAHEDESIYAECTVTVTSSSIPENTDIITAAKIGVSGTNSYSDWDPKSGFGTTSKYAGNSANAASPNTGAIQLRSKNNSGIVLTNSNGLMLKGLSVTVADGTNTLNVYAKATAYSSAADLYDTEAQGTLIGIVSATGAMTLQDGVSYDDNYQYIGMRSANGALYLNDITITWGTPTPTEYTVLFTSAHGTEPDPVEAASVTLVELSEAGWTHTGWTADADVEVDDATVTAGTLIANGKTAVLSSDVEFTAVWEEVTPTPVDPDYTTVRTDLTPNAYYTMCLDKAVISVKAGSIWRVLSKAQNGTDIILEEVTTTVAGRPYIIYATETTFEVEYTGDAVGAPVNDDDNNGLIGSFSQVSIANNPKNYIIYNNALYVVNSDNVYVGEHRAYLNMEYVPDYSEPQQQQGAPRRRVTMAVHSEQVATGMDALNASDAPVKVLINGQLYILRGEKMFDAKGQLVK